MRDAHPWLASRVRAVVREIDGESVCSRQHAHISRAGRHVDRSELGLFESIGHAIDRKTSAPIRRGIDTLAVDGEVEAACGHAADLAPPWATIDRVMAWLV